MLFKSNVWVSSIFGAIVLASTFVAWYFGMTAAGRYMLVTFGTMVLLITHAFAMMVSDRVWYSDLHQTISWMLIVLVITLIAAGFAIADLLVAAALATMAIVFAVLTAKDMTDADEVLAVSTVQAFPVVGVLFELARRQFNRPVRG